MTPTTSTLCSKRRMMNTVMVVNLSLIAAAAPPSVGRADDWQRTGGGAGHSILRPSAACLLDHHIGGTSILISARDVPQTFARAPGVDLEMRRDQTDLAHGDFRRTRKQRLAHLVVDGVQRQLQRGVERRAREAATVGATQTGIVISRVQERA